MPNSGTSPKEPKCRKGFDQQQRWASNGEALEQGLVIHIVPEEDYGFCASEEGRLVYFHRNSVAAGRFGELQVGSKVALVGASENKRSSTARLQLVHDRRIN